MSFSFQVGGLKDRGIKKSGVKERALLPLESLIGVLYKFCFNLSTIKASMLWQKMSCVPVKPDLSFGTVTRQALLLGVNFFVGLVGSTRKVNIQRFQHLTLKYIGGRRFKTAIGVWIVSTSQPYQTNPLDKQPAFLKRLSAVVRTQ
jgi:hypothetical protein